MSSGRNEADAPRGLRSIGRALAYRNYRLFFGGQGVSLIGTWMTRIATGWLVFRLFRDQPERAAFLLGMVGFAGQIPAFFVGPLAGALVDRWNRQRLLIVTQLLSLLQSGALAVVAFAGEEASTTVWTVFGLALCQGLINAFDMPGRQAFLIEMIESREDLPNAIALNSSLVNGARLIGPSLAGVVIAVTHHEGWCFVIDAVSYVGVVAALLAMRVTARARPHRSPVWRGIAEGFRYAFGFAPIRSILLLLSLLSVMGMPYTVLMPIFAADVLHGGAYAYGFLTGASGVGALIGALHLASRNSVRGLGRTIVIAGLAFSFGLIGFGLSPFFWLSMALMLLTGFGMMVAMAASNTILQTIVDEDKRGRVMSFYTMAFLGTAPFGSLIAGVVAGVIGAPATVTIGGAFCLAGTLGFALHLPHLRTLVRPIYIRMGIIPEIATGLQAAARYSQPPHD